MGSGLFRTAAVVMLGLIFAPSMSYAVPARPVAEAEGRTAYMPFDPPVDTPLRYRWEKIVTDDGKTEIEWDISSFTFEPTDQGFSLTVQSLERGSNETDPEWLAVEEKLKDLMSKPFVLQLSADGTIVSLDEANLYWGRIFKALEEGYAEAGNDGQPLKPKEREIMTRVLSIFRDMSPEARLSILTESIQPALEFAQTELTDEPLTTTIESQSPFGGTIEHEIRIGLDELDQDSALLRVHSSISPEGLRDLTKTMVSRIATLADAPLDATEHQEVKDVTATMKFQHETTAHYRVSIVSGLTEDYESTETIDVSAGGNTSRKVTVRSLKLLN